MALKRVNEQLASSNIAWYHWPQSADIAGNIDISIWLAFLMVVLTEDWILYESAQWPGHHLPLPADTDMRNAFVLPMNGLDDQQIW